MRKWLPLAIMLGLATAYAGPLLITYIANGEQDECTFGSVTNAQYRDYLRRAKQLSSSMPGSFSRNHEEARARFNELFERLIDGRPSVYDRIAASHALLRAFGAEYRNTNDMDPEPFAKIARMGGYINFHYYLDVNRLGLFQPIMRRAWIAATLTGPGDFDTRTNPSVTGDIRFAVNYPAFDLRPYIDRAPEQCPFVPNQALSESFSRSR